MNQNLSSDLISDIRIELKTLNGKLKDLDDLYYAFADMGDDDHCSRMALAQVANERCIVKNQIVFLKELLR